MQRQATLWIRTAIIMAALALCTTSAFGEEKQTSESDPVTKMLKLEHVDPNSVRELLHHLPASLLRADSELGLLVVHGPPSTVEFVEKAVKQIDAPSGRSTYTNRNVEITAWLVGARRAGDSGSEVAPLLRPVVSQLRERFPYQGYQLLETASVRLRPRERSAISGSIPDLAVEGADPASYGFNVRLGAIQPTPSGHTISVNEVRLAAKIPVRTSPGSLTNSQIQIYTQMNLPAGKTVVVGKAGVQGVVDGIFLVLQANVVD